MKKALLVGINQYETQRDLRGCITDVAEMEHILSSKFEYSAIKKITDADVSREAVIECIKELLQSEDGEEDGARLIFFAGHGGRTIEVGPGDETDRVDENLCMPSYDWSDKQSYLIDDDFGQLLNHSYIEAPHLRIYVVLDSCHSGTGTRSPSNNWDKVYDYLTHTLKQQISNPMDICQYLDWGLEDARLPTIAVSRQSEDSPAVSQRLTTANEKPISCSSLVENVSGSEPNSHLLFSGCAAAQTCKDVPIDAEYHGIFTYTLTRKATNSPDLSWADFQQEVAEAIEGFGQNPQLEGPAELKQRPIFS